MNSATTAVSESSRLAATTYASILSVSMCCVALALTVIRLVQFDVPLTRYIRSLNEFHIDYLQKPWLSRLSESADLVGGREVL